MLIGSCGSATGKSTERRAEFSFVTKLTAKLHGRATLVQAELHIRIQFRIASNAQFGGNFKNYSVMLPL